MVERPHTGWTRTRSFLVLTFLLFVIYNSNFRWLLSRDSIPTRVLPFSLLLDGHLYVDDWIEPYQQGRFAQGAYYEAKTRGHIYSVYPIIEPLVIAPLYAAPAWWLSRQHPQFAKGSFVLTTIIDTMEKLCASLIAALSAGVLYLALRKYVSCAASVVISLVYGLASTTWTISSQTLWRHGFTELSFSLLLWALSMDSAGPGYAFWAGLALGLATANKPVYVLIAIPLLIYFALNHRKRFLLFCAPLLVIGLAVLSYNFYFFGGLLGAYPNPLGSISAGTPLSPIRIPWWDGFAGLLVSPNRGLFIYSPWTVLAIWGAARIWKDNLFGWGRYLLPGLFAVYVVHSRLGSWWGGGCYGPRYLTDLFPFFAFFLIPIWPRIRFSSLATAAFVLSVAAAFWIQIVGAYYYPNGYWDSTPVAVEADPRRLWDWSDTQIMRTWEAGTRRPDLLYAAPLFFQAVSFESSRPAIRLAIIGLDGDRIRDMLKDIANEPAADLVAIADLHQGVEAKARGLVPAGVKFYSDYIKMLDEIKPEAVMVTAPTSLHLEILRECAKRHIHFSTEPPMASSALEARQMESMANAAKIKLMVNYWNTWRAASQELHGRVLGGAIGPVQKIMVRCGQATPREDSASNNHADSILEPDIKGGGALMDIGPYGAEWALWLKGRPSSVFAYSLRLRDVQAGADDDAVILLKYPTATATIQASRDWPYAQDQVEAFGPKGSLLATKDALFFQAAGIPTTLDYPDGRPIELPLVLHETSSAVAYFVYHIRHDQPIEDPVSAKINVEVAEILDAAQESIRTGRAVELPGK